MIRVHKSLYFDRRENCWVASRLIVSKTLNRSIEAIGTSKILVVIRINRRVKEIFKAF